MTREELTAKLRRYRGIHTECERLRERIAEKKDEMYHLQATVARASAVHSGAVSDRVERVIEQIDGMVDHYTCKVEEAQQEEADIIRTIELIRDSDSRTILFLRYIEGKTAEEISELLPYSVRSIWYRHNAALDLILSFVG